jgi:hypothetical protein
MAKKATEATATTEIWVTRPVLFKNKLIKPAPPAQLNINCITYVRAANSQMIGHKNIKIADKIALIMSCNIPPTF